MRIVGGTHRGRKLAQPEGRVLRPTSDRTRESLFNILEHRLEGGLKGRSVLDAFAGTGAVGLEALSRGAAHVTFLENASASLVLLKENIRTMTAHVATTIMQQDATRPPPPPPVCAAPCSVVFLDPPYNQGQGEPALVALLSKGWIADDAVVVVEVARKEPFTPPDGFTIDDERVYGAARLVILSRP